MTDFRVEKSGRRLMHDHANVGEFAGQRVMPIAKEDVIVGGSRRHVGAHRILGARGHHIGSTTTRPNWSASFAQWRARPSRYGLKVDMATTCATMRSAVSCRPPSPRRRRRQDGIAIFRPTPSAAYAPNRSSGKTRGASGKTGFERLNYQCPRDSLPDRHSDARRREDAPVA
jgi:hypothetical protein